MGGAGACNLLLMMPSTLQLLILRPRQFNRSPHPSGPSPSRHARPLDARRCGAPHLPLAHCNGGAAARATSATRHTPRAAARGLPARRYRPHCATRRLLALWVDVCTPAGAGGQRRSRGGRRRQRGAGTRRWLISRRQRSRRQCVRWHCFCLRAPLQHFLSSRLATALGSASPPDAIAVCFH